jgi:hypothetical protein
MCPVHRCLPGHLHLDQTRRCIRHWLKDYFRQRRGPRNLKPKSPVDCPACNRDCSLLPQCPKLEVLPWPERKSRRGRPKTIDTSGHACLNPLCAYFAIADPAIHALVSNGCRGKPVANRALSGPVTFSRTAKTMRNGHKI